MLRKRLLRKLDEIFIKLEYVKKVLDYLILAKRKQNAEMAKWLDEMKAFRTKREAVV